MKESYTSEEILDAVDFLHKNNIKKNNKINRNFKNDIPAETENLIVQAEKYLNK